MQTFRVVLVIFAVLNGIESCSFMLSKPQRTVIGPKCTQGVHNSLPPSGMCPQDNQTYHLAGMVDVSHGPGAIHVWPPWFSINWTMYFVLDIANKPPYTSVPNGNFTFTQGRSYYDDTAQEGRCMRQIYYHRCMPIFLTGVLSHNNNYSCEFLNIGRTNTVYLLLYDDRPPGAPECCILGQPFYAPPRNFSNYLYIRKTSRIAGIDIDWNGVTLDGAGLILYGFYHQKTPIPHDAIPASRPYASIMMGAPHLGPWMYQKFADWDPVKKVDPSIWKLPESCNTATKCPGWS